MPTQRMLLEQMHGDAKRVALERKHRNRRESPEHGLLDNEAHDFQPQIHGESLGNGGYHDYRPALLWEERGENN